MIQLDLSESCSGEAALIPVPWISPCARDLPFPDPGSPSRVAPQQIYPQQTQQKCQNLSADNQTSLAIIQNFLTNLFLSHLLGTLNKGILVIKILEVRCMRCDLTTASPETWENDPPILGHSSLSVEWGWNILLLLTSCHVWIGMEVVLCKLEVLLSAGETLGLNSLQGSGGVGTDIKLIKHCRSISLWKGERFLTDNFAWKNCRKSMFLCNHTHSLTQQ